MKIELNEMYNMVEDYFSEKPSCVFYTDIVSRLLDYYSESEMADDKGEYVNFPNIADGDYAALFDFFAEKASKIMDQHGIADIVESIYNKIDESCQEVVRQDEEFTRFYGR